MGLFDKRFVFKYIWSFFISALMIAVLSLFFNGFKGDFSKRISVNPPIDIPLTAFDTSIVLTTLSQGENVNLIALDYKNRTMALAENERGYRGWLNISSMYSSGTSIPSLPVIKASALSTFTPKSFEKKVLGRQLNVIEKKYALALDIKPLYGSSFEAVFPFRIYNYSSGSVTENVKIIFVDGKATSYQMNPVESLRWENNKYFPLVPAMISLGWAGKAHQSDILLKYSNRLPFDASTLFPDTFWGGLLKVVSIIILVFLSLAFFGMIPYCIEKPVLDIVRFSPVFSRIGGKIFVIVFNFFVYYVSLQALYIWIGFSWVALVIALICMLRVILRNMPLLTCPGYVYLMDAKCEQCNRSSSYEKTEMKVISSVPYNDTLHGDFFKIPPRRRTRRERLESIYKTDVTPKHYRKFKEADPSDETGAAPAGYVEEYEYTFKCKYCGRTSLCRTKDRVERPTEIPQQVPAPPEPPSVLEDDTVEETTVIPKE